MNASQGNVIGAGIGPDEKFVLRSRKVLAALIMLAPAFGFSAESIEALQGFADKLETFVSAALGLQVHLEPLIAFGLVLWSTVRADGAELTWKPKLSWVGKLKLLRKLSKLAAVGVVLLPIACAATVTKTDDVTSVTWVWGAAQVSAGEECSEGEDCDGVSISGGHASEGFLAAVMSPISTVLKGLLSGL